ncbi:MAG: TIGR03757 family integrating conjugative element protein [Candidatus Rokubacteria bacterium]|nr:TIGR03757 family integrating conjugative element protein [Candidatus Rokubacteria bacterium]
MHADEFFVDLMTTALERDEVLTEIRFPIATRIGSAYQGVADAWGLGLAKVPAVVVDRRYVVYGEPDVARAVARIESHRRAQP